MIENIDKVVETFQSKWFAITVDILIFAIMVKLSNIFIDKFSARINKCHDDLELKKQIMTIKSIIKSIVNTILITFGVMYVLNALGIDIRPILTAAGVLGVAVGLGAKRFFEDIITGLSLLLEGQIRVGDFVEISGFKGVVEKADIKLIRLRDIKGRVHYIRNGMVDIVTNYTRDFSYYVFDVTVAYKENIAHVMKVLKDLGEDFKNTSELKKYILSPLELFGLEEFGDSAITIRARFRTTPIKQWDVGRAFNLKIKEKFDELGIEIPFPQRVIHIDKNINEL